MAMLDDINMTLRDFEVVSTAHPAPIGDPASGRHNIMLPELRELLKTIAQTVGDPSALAELQQQIGEAGRLYPSRAAAAAGAASLPSSVTQILVREGTALVLRSRTAYADDPLFTTAPQWGVVQRQDVAAETAARERVISGGDAEGTILVSVQDAAGAPTFLTARRSDGAPTHEAAALIARSQWEAGVFPTAVVEGSPFLDDLLFFLRDATGAPAIDTMIRREDGRFHDAAIASIAERLPIPRPHPDGTWDHPAGGRFAKWDADTRCIVSWGSSSPEISGPAWQEMAGQIGATLLPRARGGQISEHVLIQLGAVKPVVTGGTLGAAAGSSVTLSLETVEGASGAVLHRTDGMLVNGALRIPGWVVGENSAVTFTRTDAGTSVDLSGRAWRFWSDDERLRDKTALIWTGKNDISLGQSAEGAVAEVLRITGYLSPLSPRYLVIGLFPSAGYTADQLARVTAANALLAETYGDLFVPVMPSLLGTQIFSDLGLTPTQADLDARAAGHVPPSLMMDTAHLTTAAYRWITQNLIKPKLTSELGWYTEN